MLKVIKTIIQIMGDALSHAHSPEMLSSRQKQNCLDGNNIPANNKKTENEAKNVANNNPQTKPHEPQSKNEKAMLDLVWVSDRTGSSVNDPSSMPEGKASAEMTTHLTQN